MLLRVFLIAILLYVSEADESDLPSEYQRIERAVAFNGGGNALKNSVGGGTPGIDFPTLKSIPRTDFNCQDRLPGYYANEQYGCQVFHICHSDRRKDTFLCPNGTIFNQKQLICDWWYNVDCTISHLHENVNANIGNVSGRKSKKISKPVSRTVAPKKPKPFTQTKTHVSQRPTSQALFQQPRSEVVDRLHPNNEIANQPDQRNQFQRPHSQVVSRPRPNNDVTIHLPQNQLQQPRSQVVNRLQPPRHSFPQNSIQPQHSQVTNEPHSRNRDSQTIQRQNQRIDNKVNNQRFPQEPPQRKESIFVKTPPRQVFSKPTSRKNQDIHQALHRTPHQDKNVREKPRSKVDKIHKTEVRAFGVPLPTPSRQRQNQPTNPRTSRIGAGRRSRPSTGNTITRQPVINSILSPPKRDFSRPTTSTNFVTRPVIQTTTPKTIFIQEDIPEVTTHHPSLPENIILPPRPSPPRRVHQSNLIEQQRIKTISQRGGRISHGTPGTTRQNSHKATSQARIGGSTSPRVPPTITSRTKQPTPQVFGLRTAPRVRTPSIHSNQVSNTRGSQNTRLHIPSSGALSNRRPPATTPKKTRTQIKKPNGARVVVNKRPLNRVIRPLHFDNDLDDFDDFNDPFDDDRFDDHIDDNHFNDNRFRVDRFGRFNNKRIDVNLNNDNRFGVGAFKAGNFDDDRFDDDRFDDDRFDDDRFDDDRFDDDRFDDDRFDDDRFDDDRFDDDRFDDDRFDDDRFDDDRFDDDRFDDDRFDNDRFNNRRRFSFNRFDDDRFDDDRFDDDRFGDDRFDDDRFDFDDDPFDDHDDDDFIFSARRRKNLLKVDLEDNFDPFIFSSNRRSRANEVSRDIHKSPSEKSSIKSLPEIQLPPPLPTAS